MRCHVRRMSAVMVRHRRWPACPVLLLAVLVVARTIAALLTWLIATALLVAALLTWLVAALTWLVATLLLRAAARSEAFRTETAVLALC